MRHRDTLETHGCYSAHLPVALAADLAFLAGGWCCCCSAGCCCPFCPFFCGAPAAAAAAAEAVGVAVPAPSSGKAVGMGQGIMDSTAAVSWGGSSPASCWCSPTSAV